MITVTEPSATASRSGPAVGGSRLSPRERELVRLVAQGSTDTQIAGGLVH